MSFSLIIGSRASFLAKIQTFIVKQELRKKIKNINFITKFHKTLGDKNQGGAPWKQLGYGIFTGSFPIRDIVSFLKRDSNYQM